MNSNRKINRAVGSSVHVKIREKLEKDTYSNVYSHIEDGAWDFMVKGMFEKAFDQHTLIQNLLRINSHGRPV